MRDTCFYEYIIFTFHNDALTDLSTTANDILM